MPWQRWGWAAGALLLALSTSCGGSEAGCEPAPRDPECPDLRFRGVYYDEWKETQPPPILQEQGNAAFPACNDAELCGPDLGGFASTDVWLLEGVDTEDAIMGYRQNTEIHVIFVRRGLDPETVPGLREAAEGQHR